MPNGRIKYLFITIVSREQETSLLIVVAGLPSLLVELFNPTYDKVFDFDQQDTVGKYFGEALVRLTKEMSFKLVFTFIRQPSL